MPGFVDVTGWTSEEVRRMGHADDYDEPYTASNRKYYSPIQSNKAKVVLDYDANDVWAASVAAQRINGSYIKAVAPGIDQKTNRQIVIDMLNSPETITQEDRDQAEVVRRYFKALTFKIIEGKTLNDYLKGAMTIANKDNITTTYDLAVIASLPATYEKSSKRDDVDRRIRFAQGGFVGEPGEIIQLNIEVVKRLWSEKFNTWYLTCMTPEDQVVFFAFRKEVNVGDTLSIQGKVKSKRDNSTQLSHVKVK